MARDGGTPTRPVWEKAKAEKNWLVWARVPRKRQRDGTTQIAKVPLDPSSGHEVDRLVAASLSWDEAQALVEAKTFGAYGVGYVPRAGSAMVGDDLDNCFDEKGKPDEWAKELLALGETYCERSPSGRGLRVLRARPQGEEPLSTEARGVGSFEIVEKSRGKFFTVRGEGCGSVQEVGDAPRTRAYVLGLYAERVGRAAAAGGAGKGERLPAEIVAHILAELAPESEYNEWINVGLATKWCLGEDGFGLWEAWSRGAGNYQGEDDCRAKWDSLDPTGHIAGGSLLMKLDREGKSLPEELKAARAQSAARSDFEGG